VNIRLLSVLGVAALTSVIYSAGVASAEPTPGTCPLPTYGPGNAYRPTIDPARFGPEVDNPWFPLPVGRTLIYSGTKEGQRAHERFTPTTTRMVDGVRTRVVRDLLYLDGVLAERTSDYYAQDRCGNVWYFGEDTAELNADGTVNNTDGSWHAGVGGAQPGVFMQADPELGRRFRQEWLAGEAEDVYRAVDLCASVTVPDGPHSCALRTEERTALEPGTLDAKYYARGIGTVKELAVKGPTERLELTDIDR
jgi:hypothetical protein